MESFQPSHPGLDHLLNVPGENTTIPGYRTRLNKFNKNSMAYQYELARLEKYKSQPTVTPQVFNEKRTFLGTKITNLDTTNNLVTVVKDLGQSTLDQDTLEYQVSRSLSRTLKEKNWPGVTLELLNRFLDINNLNSVFESVLSLENLSVQDICKTLQLIFESQVTKELSRLSQVTKNSRTLGHLTFEDNIHGIEYVEPKKYIDSNNLLESINIESVEKLLEQIRLKQVQQHLFQEQLKAPKSVAGFQRVTLRVNEKNKPKPRPVAKPLGNFNPSTLRDIDVDTLNLPGSELHIPRVKSTYGCSERWLKPRTKLQDIDRPTYRRF